LTEKKAKQIGKQTVLIVDDDSSVTASLSLLLKQAGLAFKLAADPETAIRVLQQDPISLVLQDMNFSRSTSGEEGIELLQQIRQFNSDIPVILMTAWGSIELAVEGMKLGASDFITKPWNNQHLLQLVRTALRLAEPEPEETQSREELDRQFDFSDIVGEHPAMLKTLALVGRVCKTDAPVLILGESGTGKELIANALHHNSGRAAGPLVKVNLGGVPSSLFESEMFGHVKGAFTDAQADRSGRFQLADGGSIFLDEAGELEPSSQVKLLRVLEDRSFQPVGSSTSMHTDVRIISATNRDLGEMMEAGTFREDLYYRLNLITLRLPALRERRSDIRLIARHHLHRVAEMYGIAEISIDENAWLWLESLDWPGNVRQLRQTVERAVLMSGKSHLGQQDFVDPELVPDTAKEREIFHQSESMTLDEMEKLMIEKSLLRHGHNISKVAHALGLSRAALYRRLEKYGLGD
jgi:two-component system NtrC family response regulator